MSYEEALRLEKLEIADDEFGFERCENEYLSLERSDRSEKTSMRVRRDEKKTLIESRLDND